MQMLRLGNAVEKFTGDLSGARDRSALSIDGGVGASPRRSVIHWPRGKVLQ
jgi:hypothetical protein